MFDFFEVPTHFFWLKKNPDWARGYGAQSYQIETLFKKGNVPEKNLLTEQINLLTLKS